MRSTISALLVAALSVALTGAATVEPAGATAAPSTSSASAGRSSPAPAAYCPEHDAYEVTPCGAAPAPPAGSALAAQLGWVLGQLSGGQAPATPDDVRAHLAPGLLAVPGSSADDVAAAFAATTESFGALRFEGFAYPPRQRQALVLVRAVSGMRAEIPLSVSAAGLVDSIAVSAAGPMLVPRGRYSGWFDVGGGRRMFLRCTGHGTPTVVFENGLTTDWVGLQDRVSPTTRTCSYDPARQNGPSSRSDSAPAPRTGADRIADLHRLLTVAGVPGPYVLVAHSNGGLFSLGFASRYPRRVAGMVLVDGVHPSYHRRTIDALIHLVPRRQRAAARAQYCAVPPRFVDWERMDICRSERQVRRQLRLAPVHPMPLAVISHGLAEGQPGEERRIAERVWQQLQRELADLVPGASRTVARRSGHDVQHTQPGLVVRKIVAVVAAVRAGRTTLVGTH